MATKRPTLFVLINPFRGSINAGGTTTITFPAWPNTARRAMEATTAALMDTRVVLITGARQTGKSTLVQALRSGGAMAQP